MIKKSKMPFKCINCGGMKYIGETYHAFSTWYVDVTCLICAHSRDIEVTRLNFIINALNKAYFAKKEST